ncbi:hypothetical protein ASD54_08625 [Rhizobium sp. Root149]|nr:hypothetical protein ASD54_08625 [Rhizobium sp. Root149]
MNAYQFCRDMYQILRGIGVSPNYIATFVKRSPQTLRRYMSEPGTKAAQKPPLEVTDRLVALIDILERGHRPQTKDEFRLMCEWTDIVNRAEVPKSMLANIAGVSDYHLAWVGRSHPSFGIQPTLDQVATAMAVEALMQGVAA